MWPANSTSRYIGKRIENTCLRKNCTRTFLAASFDNGQKEDNFHVYKPKVAPPYDGTVRCQAKGRRPIHATSWRKLENTICTSWRQGWRQPAHLFPLGRLLPGGPDLSVGSLKGPVSSPRLPPRWHVDWSPGQRGGLWITPPVALSNTCLLPAFPSSGVWASSRRSIKS